MTVIVTVISRTNPKMKRGELGERFENGESGGVHAASLRNLLGELFVCDVPRLRLYDLDLALRWFRVVF